MCFVALLVLLLALLSLSSRADFFEEMAKVSDLYIAFLKLQSSFHYHLYNLELRFERVHLESYLLDIFPLKKCILKVEIESNDKVSCYKPLTESLGNTKGRNMKIVCNTTIQASFVLTCEKGVEVKLS